MLPESIHDALRARLTADFNALTQAVTDAAALSDILHDLIRATNDILFDLASTWSEAHNTARRLPPEMLSACFMMLNAFTDRITVSHVSRAWRAAALAHPAIWADIDFSPHHFRDEPALLRMALSRSRQYPVKLRAPGCDSSGTVASCLAQHINHIRTLKSVYLEYIPALSLPAPMLETLSISGVRGTWVIPEDFLGSRVGKLTVLDLTACFPQTCPALSTVTNLTLWFPSDPEHAETYSRLFQLFPVLQSLALQLISLDSSHFLPRGPAPPTLVELELLTVDANYDLVRHYVDWQFGDNLRDVRLEVAGSTVLECNLQDFITDVVGLTVHIIGGPFDAAAMLIARCPGRRTRVFAFDDADYDGSQAAELLLRAKSALIRVRALEIPANTLDAFVRLGVFAVLPKLAHLRIVVVGSPDHEFLWDSLASLPRVLDARPRLKSIVITATCNFDEDESPLAADARALLAVLENVAPGLPDIRIKGFAEEDVRDVQIRSDLNIQFDYSL